MALFPCNIGSSGGSAYQFIELSQENVYYSTQGSATFDLSGYDFSTIVAVAGKTVLPASYTNAASTICQLIDNNGQYVTKSQTSMYVTLSLSIDNANKSVTISGTSGGIGNLYVTWTLSAILV